MFTKWLRRGKTGKIHASERGNDSTQTARANAHRTHGRITVFNLEDAYNKVNISILAGKLSRMGVSDMLIRWFVAMLGRRRCQMRFSK